MTSGKTNLVMTVIGFVVSTVFIVFVCTRLICARLQLRASRRNFQRHLLSSRSNLSSSLERGLHGVEPPMVANFPTKKYGDDYFSASDSGQCSICLAEYHKEDVLRILPYCGHFFHINCIDIWLLQHCTCPVCRISLRETNERKRSMQLMSSSRSQYSRDSAGVHSYHCRFLARTSETRQVDTMQQDHRLLQVADFEVEESGDNMQLSPQNGVSENSTSKNLESPSLS